MSEYGTDIIFQMNKLNIELKQKLEMVLKWRGKLIKIYSIL